MRGMGFGKKVKVLRDRMGISNRALAQIILRQLGKGRLSPQTVDAWLKEKRLPRLDEAMALAAFFGHTLDELAYDKIPLPSLLPDDELRLLDLYRSLKNTGRIDIDRAVSGLALAVGFPSSSQVGVPLDPSSGTEFPGRRNKREERS